MDATGQDNNQDSHFPIDLNVLSGHFPLLVGFISSLFVALRILSAAGFDAETAYAIVQAGGAASAIIGASLSAVGVISLGVALVSADGAFFTLSVLAVSVIHSSSSSSFLV
jgi:hypothetical protein